MARRSLSFLVVFGLVILPYESSGEDPFMIMQNVMRRMRTELEHASSNIKMNKQLNRFKNHVNHIVRIHIVAKKGMPPPSVVLSLEAFMKGQMVEMETQMRQLLTVVHSSFGIQKVHFLMKKVREHCNRHIVKMRKKAILKLKEKPVKKFIAFNGKWNQNEAKRECHQHGGHLALIVSEEERIKAVRAIGDRKGNFFVNGAHPHGHPDMKWLVSTLTSSYAVRKSPSCVILNMKKGGLISPGRCQQKQGVLCQFLSFSPYVRHVGKRAFVYLRTAGSFQEGKQRCKDINGKVAIMHNEEDKNEILAAAKGRSAFIAAMPKGLIMASDQSKSARNSSVVRETPCNCFVINGTKIIKYEDKRPLPVICDVRVIPDSKARVKASNAIGKRYIAFNKKTDLFSKQEAAAKCGTIGGSIARIRSNVQQLAAVSALHHGYAVRLDSLSGAIDEYRWSDGSRLANNQAWRVANANMEQGVSLNKFGVWNPAVGSMGVLCEVVHTSDKQHPRTGFTIELRMDIDYRVVTASTASENMFIRAVEAEIRKLFANTVDAAVIFLRPGSTIAKVRVWTSSTSGRRESEKLKDSIMNQKFAVSVFGRKIFPTAKQQFDIHYDVTICIFPYIERFTKNLFIIPVVAIVAGVVLIFIISMIICKCKRKQQKKEASVFTVDKEKQLFTVEEKKVLPGMDAPPPYPENEECLPDYDTVIASRDMII